MQAVVEPDPVRMIVKVHHRHRLGAARGHRPLDQHWGDMVEVARSREHQLGVKPGRRRLTQTIGE
ncbi:MAG: hypothetical protein PSX79_09750, partial [bacterium]|nr:hypothetical protein [bacterium]